MADTADGASADPQITFKVKVGSDRLHTITMAESATVASLKAKLAGPDFEDIPPERQRLIHSGRVMKNDDLLSIYKIKPNNVVHLVKSAASNPASAPPSSSSTSAAPQVPANMAAGTANNPLASLTGARYAGLANLPSADMFGPDGGMTTPMMDEDQIANMLSNPSVAQQMNEMMNNDQFIDMMIQSNPMLRNHPNAREMIRSPIFRQMMTNPDAIRSAARIQRIMNQGGNDRSAFPMPGVTDTTPGAGNAHTANNGSTADQLNNLFDPATWANPRGSLGGLFDSFATPATGTGTGQSAATSTTPGNAGTQTTGSTNNDSTATAGQGQGGNAQGGGGPAQNPFASLLGPSPNAGGVPFGIPLNPEALQQLAQLMGVPGPASPAAPPDNRPPEERYAEQLRQLNDMGFYDFDRNVAALRRSGGSVQGAIEHLLGPA
ncbi:hypothetical protein F4803DRAFT_225258 [Xylaria telfairii]|nr:hypothetical protein F4803DRAFT_225258 [Xylaria telfairii]